MMKKLISSVLLISAICISHAQTVLFSDNFESGTSNWMLTGSFGLTSSSSYSPSNSLSESPTGNYPDNTTMSATMSVGVNLSSMLSAELSFWAIYQIEQGFDYMYVDISSDGGNSWVNISSFDGENFLTPWIKYTFSLGGFVGASDVRVRFRFVSDAGLNFDGMYIDDVTITGSNVDNAVPFVIHIPPEHYKSSVGPHHVQAQLIDISGISLAEVTYRVDGGSTNIVTGINTIGNTYLFTIPQQLPGSNVEYWITATDASVANNSVTTDTFNYIAGNYVAFDNGVVDFVNSFGPASAGGMQGTAVRITLNGSCDITTALIRNYTDINRPNNNILVHLWTNVGGMPGTDIITPILIAPEASLSNPNPMTRVDLRPYSSQLSGISGDIWLGFTVPTGEAWLTQSTPGLYSRTMVFTGTTWQTVTDDYHFRLITSPFAGAPAADFSIDTSNKPQIQFTDLSGNLPTSWSWDFGYSGQTSPNQHASHTFLVNGTFNVCLTAFNSIGNDTKCRLVNIDNYAVANFMFDTTQAPNITFTDISSGNPTQWLWDFDDQGATSNAQHPMHVFSGPGTYDVCLTVINAFGTSSPVCKFVSFTSTGIDQPLETKPGINVYPNPANEILWIESLGESNFIHSLELTDISGKILSQWKPGHINLAKLPTGHLSKGMYIIRVHTSQGLFSRMVVIQ